MGYSERICQLCSTSFNIGRIRRADEPFSAAWDYQGNHFVDAATDCDAEDCGVVHRPRGEPSGGDGVDDDEDDDGDEDEDEKEDEDEVDEHIAGPHCESTSGYSGHRISVEEMKGCHRVQCIMQKDEDWSPEPGDEDFVLKSERCWLTGISNGPPDEFEIEGLEPVLHGVESTMINDAPQEESDWGNPVHPHCFQIFSRLSRLAFGTVNLDGLLRHWNARGERFENLQKWTKSTDIPMVLEQWYSHEPGTEYLVANPLEIPGLQPLIDGCLWGDQQREETVFPIARYGDHDSDPFTRLSPELVMMIIAQLPRRDVATLRLASRVFRQLPQTYFQTLVSSEMPWMSWELDSIPPRDLNWHKLWCELSLADGGARRDEALRPWREYVNFPDCVSSTWVEILSEPEQEELRGYENGSGHHLRSWGIPEDQKERVKEIVAKYMPPGNSSWPSPKQLHGLRNRRRIYEDLQDVISKIKEIDAGGVDVKWCLLPADRHG